MLKPQKKYSDVVDLLERFLGKEKTAKQILAQWKRAGYRNFSLQDAEVIACIHNRMRKKAFDEFLVRFACHYRLVN